MIQVFRAGVYGIARKENKLLVITQERGPFKGRFDLPGGKIEFGETPEEALHREFIEEVGMDFKGCSLLTNLSNLMEVPSIEGKPPFYFHQLALIYIVDELAPLNLAVGLPHCWLDIEKLETEKTSPILGKIIYDGLLLVS